MFVYLGTGRDVTKWVYRKGRAYSKEERTTTTNITRYLIAYLNCKFFFYYNITQTRHKFRECNFLLCIFFFIILLLKRETTIKNESKNIVKPDTFKINK